MIGDLISMTLLRLGYGWSLYQKTMLISVDLDKEGRIWRFPTEAEKAEQFINADKTFARDPLEFKDDDNDRVDDRAE